MFVETNGARLFFDTLNSKLEIAGAGPREKPTLLCLPGGPGSDRQTLRPFLDGRPHRLSRSAWPRPQQAWRPDDARGMG